MEHKVKQYDLFQEELDALKKSRKKLNHSLVVVLLTWTVAMLIALWAGVAH